MLFRKSLCALLVAQTCILGSVGLAPSSSTVAKAETQSPDSAVRRSAKIALAAPAGNQKNKAQDADMLEKYFLDGTLKQGREGLQLALDKNPGDDNRRFALGVIQFLCAVEGLGQDLNKYGLRQNISRGVGPARNLVLPFGTRKPELLTYNAARKMVQDFLDGLTQSQATLEQIKDPDVKLPLHFGLIKLDLNGDGKADSKECLWKIYTGIDNAKYIDEAKVKEFYIKFDRADVHWLRGYCHLISGFCEIFLAHDTKEFFDCAAHIFFQKVDSPYKFLDTGKRVHTIGRDLDIVDVVAMFHLIRWKVSEKERMALALHHFESVVSESRVSWKFIMAETDDDHEWIPNPKQTGVMPGMGVTEEMVKSWGGVQDEIEKILQGKLLIPFWRGDGTQGVNVRKAFLEPRDLDLVLWIQGPAAAPFLEKGEMSKGQTWNSLRSAFGSNFPGFAIWFN